MFQLDRHIEILLLDNDCVIVPGLGGFIAHHVSAHYDEESKTFVPPLRTLGFNRQLQINDSLLAQSYIEAYDISYPEAIRRIESEVNELIQTLHTDGFFELNDIGVLHLNADEKITFEPCEAGILTPQLYGLNLVDINPLIMTEVKQEPKTRKPKMPMSVSLNEIDGTDEEDIEEQEKPAKTITIRLSTIKYALASAAAIIFLIVFALPLTFGDQQGLIKSGLDTSSLNRMLPKQNAEQLTKNNENQDTLKLVSQEEASNTDTIKTETVKVEDTQIAEVKETPVKENKEPAPVKVEQKASQPHFSLVLASRVTKVNAQDYVKRLKKNGITAQVIQRSNGCQVVTGNYKSQSEAQNALRSYRNGCDTFADAWITNVN